MLLRALSWPRVVAAIAPAMAVFAAAGNAGIVNPDISVIGQPFASLTSDRLVAGRNRLRLDVGETEFVFDAALNPYARGKFILALSSEGFELEEGFFSLVRGLPLDFALVGGRYRVGFGRLNLVHPHALAFAERFDVLAAYLPGEESLAETGVSLSRLVPLPGEFSLQISADWLQGDSFRIAREPSSHPDDPITRGGDDAAGEARPAFATRISGFGMVGERSGIEVGVSALGGTNNVSAGTRTRVYGADAKAKLWTSSRAHLVVQAEALFLDREDAAWDPVSGFRSTRITPAGGYAFADYNWAARYNIGAAYEGFQRPSAGEEWDQSIGAFAGYSLLEETTAVRLDWRRILPDAGDDFDRFTLRVIYSMGPHKVHVF